MKERMTMTSPAEKGDSHMSQDVRNVNERMGRKKMG